MQNGAGLRSLSSDMVRRLCELDLNDSPRSVALVLSSCRQLLAITGVKARDIVGYTTIVMLFAAAWMALALLVF